MYWTKPARVIALAIGVFYLLVGFWAFLDPASFYSLVATFQPSNLHFLHDAGAFQVGLGLALLLPGSAWARAAARSRGCPGRLVTPFRGARRGHASRRTSRHRSHRVGLGLSGSRRGADRRYSLARGLTC